MREHSQAYYLWQLVRTVRNWPVYLLNRAGFLRGRTVTYRLRNGLRVTSRGFPLDRGAINEVWLDRIYDPPGFDWQNATVILDIGANIGSFTLFAAARSSRARIMAFEPDPSTVEVLRRNVAQNGLQDRIAVEEAGVAAQDGEQTFFVAGKCSWFSSLYAKPSADMVPVTIRTVSLASVFARYHLDDCDLLKIDCEGAEYEILYTAPPELLRRVHRIVLEHHPFLADKDPRATPAALRAYLEEQGFRVQERQNDVFYAERPATRQTAQSSVS